MNKKEAQALARELGVRYYADATAEEIMEGLQAQVDALADRLLATGGHEEREPILALLAEAERLGLTPTEEPESVEDATVAAGTALVPVEAEDEVAIALRDHQPVPRLPGFAEYQAAKAWSESLAMSRVVPDSYRGRPDDVLAVYLYGMELGLGLMVALRDIYMIEGRAAVAAHRQLGLLRSGGVAILESDSNDERAYIVARRRDTGEVMRVEFTYAEAQKIQSRGKPLVDGANWRNYRKDMLWARTVGRLSRRLGPDLIGGSVPPYVAEEVYDFEGYAVEIADSGEVTGRQQPAPQQQRRQQQSNLPPHRKERPDYNWPASWAELLERLGGHLADDTALWLLQVSQELWPGTEVVNELDAPSKRTLYHRAEGALAHLDDSGTATTIGGGTRQTAQNAFASVLGGAILEGPPWAVDGTEEHLPTREQYETEELERLRQDAENGSVVDEDIPFGSDDSPY